jgi:hypothetical protein
LLKKQRAADVEDLRVREPEVAEALHVRLRDRGRVSRHLLGEVHDGDVDLVEAGVPVVEDDVPDLRRLEEPVSQHLAVRERAVAAATVASSYRRGSIVPAISSFSRSHASYTAWAVGEEPRVVRHVVADQLDESHVVSSSPSRSGASKPVPILDHVWA